MYYLTGAVAILIILAFALDKFTGRITLINYYYKYPTLTAVKMYLFPYLKLHYTFLHSLICPALIIEASHTRRTMVHR